MASQPAAVPRSLPRGRHAAARSVVLASQRGRLLEAMASAVAERGYAQTTVSEVIARAGVSRKTFYEHFADRQECFLAAWELGTDLLIDQIRDAAARASGWEERLRAGTTAFLAVLSAEPEFARTFLVEVLGAGEAALERRAANHRRFAELLLAIHAEARAEGAPLGELDELTARAATGAVWELVAEQVRTRGAEGLLDLAEPIVRIELALFGGAPAGGAAAAPRS